MWYGRRGNQRAYPQLDEGGLFNSMNFNKHIKIEWKTDMVLDICGFEIQRGQQLFGRVIHFIG